MTNLHYQFTVARLLQSGELTDAPDPEDPESWNDSHRCRWLRRRDPSGDWLYLAVFWCSERWGWVACASAVVAEDLHCVTSEQRFRGPVEAGADALRRLRESGGERALQLLDS